MEKTPIVLGHQKANEQYVSNRMEGQLEKSKPKT